MSVVFNSVALFVSGLLDLYVPFDVLSLFGCFNFISHRFLVVSLIRSLTVSFRYFLHTFLTGMTCCSITFRFEQTLYYCRHCCCIHRYVQLVFINATHIIFPHFILKHIGCVHRFAFIHFQHVEQEFRFWPRMECVYFNFRFLPGELIKILN